MCAADLTVCLLRDLPKLTIKDVMKHYDILSCNTAHALTLHVAGTR